MLIDQGKPEDALQYLNEAVNIRTDGYSDGHWRTAEALYQRGRCYILLENFVDAETDLITAHRFFAVAFGVEHTNVLDAEKLLSGLPRCLNNPEGLDSALSRPNN